MFHNKRSTQNLTITYLKIKLFAISTTDGALIATTFNPESAVFENQTCQHNKCLKFNLKLINNSWEFLVRAAQKAMIAKKISQSLSRFVKKAICNGDNAAECLARQGINLIKHQANAIGSPTTPVPTQPPPLIKSPCEINPDVPGCYA